MSCFVNAALKGKHGILVVDEHGLPNQNIIYLEQKKYMCIYY